jgi:hypothetical protein
MAKPEAWAELTKSSSHKRYPNPEIFPSTMAVHSDGIFLIECTDE